MMSRPFRCVCPSHAASKPREAAADDLLRTLHDPIDQLFAGRSVMDEPGHHAAAPHSCIHDAFLQDSTVLRSGDEVADILYGRSSALVALDVEDLFYCSIGQHALGIAQRPHDQPRLQFICSNQRSFDVVLRRRLPRGNEPRSHVAAVGAEASAATRLRASAMPPDATNGISSSSATRGSRTMFGISSSPGCPPHSKPSTLTASQPIRSAVSEWRTEVHL
jgi:hypothetical protein